MNSSCMDFFDAGAEGTVLAPSTVYPDLVQVKFDTGSYDKGCDSTWFTSPERCILIDPLKEPVKKVVKGRKPKVVKKDTFLWGVEVNGKVSEANLRSSRSEARGLRTFLADCFPEDTVHVRKIKLQIVKGR